MKAPSGYRAPASRARSRLAFKATALALALVLPFQLSRGQLSAAVFIMIAAVGVIGLNVLTGYTGQISLGHAFFLAVGAYTAAILGADHGLSAALWIPAAGLVAAIVGTIVGPVALRLRGLYLAVVTLGLVYVGQFVLNNATWSGGPQGRAFPSVVFGAMSFAPGHQLTVLGLVIDRDGLYYYFALILVTLGLAITANLMRSRPGRAMQAVKEREIAASIMGINVARTKVAAFALSSFLAGVAGALYASYLSFAQPAQWDLPMSIQYLAALIVGGMGTVYGPVLGSMVVFGLPSLINTLSLTSASGGIPPGDLTAIIYGVLIIVFLVVEPGGMAAIVTRAARWSPRRPSRLNFGTSQRRDAHVSDTRVTTQCHDQAGPCDDVAGSTST